MNLPEPYVCGAQDTVSIKEHAIHGPILKTVDTNTNLNKTPSALKSYRPLPIPTEWNINSPCVVGITSV